MSARVTMPLTITAKFVRPPIKRNLVTGLANEWALLPPSPC